MQNDVTAVAVSALDATAMAAAQSRLDRLSKPPGSLGRLEELAIWLAGVTGNPQPSFPRKAVVVAAADHGVTAAGVSAYPSDVTAEMVRTYLRGGAAINVLARMQGATVLVVDAGVRTEPVRDGVPAPTARFIARRIGAGTADMRLGPAMTRAQARAALQAGIELVPLLLAGGVDLLATGDMGIGNTTAAAAITAARTGAPVNSVCGRGTGIDDAALERKRNAVATALALNRPDSADGLDMLAKVGGFEFGVLAGLILGAAEHRLPILLDGYVTAAAALIAQAIAPAAIDYCVAAHQSAEPGHRFALQRLALEPYLQLNMRLGEGSGAALMFALVEAASRLLTEMATLQEAGVSGPSA